MERETITVTTPEGHAVVLYAYLTGLEANEAKQAVFSSMKVNVGESGEPTVGEMSGTFLIEQERVIMGKVVVSIDGNTEDPVGKLLALRASEYSFVKAEVDKITNPATPGK